MERSGTHILIVDGAPADRADAIWKAATRTTFRVAYGDAAGAQGARDVPDLFAGYEAVDRRRGIGVKPVEGWTIEAAANASDATFATATKGSIVVALIVEDQGGTVGMLEPLLASQIPGFDPRGLKPATIAGAPGVQFEMNNRGTAVRFLAAVDAVRMYIAVVRGPVADVAAAQDSIQTLLDGIVSEPGY